MRPSKSRFNILLWAFALAALAGIGVGYRTIRGQALAGESGRAQITGDELAELQKELPAVQSVSKAFKLVAKIAKPGVVHIRVSGGEDTADSDRLRRLREQFKGMIPDEQIDRFLRRLPDGSASGIIIDGDGYILTNNHVVEGRENISVVLFDESEYKAKLVGTDPKTDLAVVKIDAENLRPLTLGDSNAIEVGDWVIAVGSPFGLQQTVTHGIVSAKDRTAVAGMDIDYQDFIQTDAAINPGNSGGPLLNLRGEVIGVNTAIATHGDGVNAGIAFTIPSNMATKIANQLKTSGKVTRGWLGLTFTEIRKEDTDVFGLPAAKGVLVESVLKGSPAERGGLKVEDVIIALNDTELDTREQLKTLVADLPPDEVVRMRLIRDRQEEKAEVRLGLQPDDMRASRRAAFVGNREVPYLGLEVRTLRVGMLRTYDEQARGVVVMGLDETWGAAPDVKPLELVVACNDKPVKSVYDLNEALKNAPANQKVKLEVLEPTGDRRIISVKPRTK